MSLSSEKRSGSTDSEYLEKIEKIEQEWSKFRRALKADEKEFFDKMIEHAKVHRKAGESKEGTNNMETFFMSVILEQQLEIMRLKKKLDEGE